MRNCFLLISLFLLTTLVACKDTKWVELPSGNPPEGAITGQPGEDEPENPANKVLINSSYIRGGLFEQGRIASESMAACNDLIYLAARPYADGEIAFELPVNDATLVGGTSYEATYNGRNGVMKFDGTGKMNVGDGLLHSADAAFTQFTFATYIYIDQWVEGAYLFKKSDSKSIIAAFQLGTAEGTLSLSLGGKSIPALKNTALTVGGWHYLAIHYTGTKLRLFVDNVSSETEITLAIPNTIADFYIGENLKGRLDETVVFSISAGTSAKNGIDPTTWAGSKALAYWKYDDASNPGKDAFTWLNTLEKIRTALNGQQGERKLRLGVAGGRWKDMVANEGARSTFAYNLKALLEKYKLDGIDLDFEWPENATEYSNYSTAILKIRQILGKDVFFTVSLHPVSFKISKPAINAVDFISYQCYGPATMRYPLQQFKDDAKAALEYGIPADKLVMGVPFIGTTGAAGEQVGYRDFVTQGGLTDSALDQIVYNGKTYVFNGQNTIRLKTIYSCTSGFRGIMSWDLATDLPVTNSMSLLKIVKEEMDSYSSSVQ